MTQSGTKLAASESNNARSGDALQWIAMALCAAILVLGIAMQFIISKPDSAGKFAPEWLFLFASLFSLAGVIPLSDSSSWNRTRKSLLWIGVLLMVWLANGLPFDLLRLTPLMPVGETDWSGFAIRSMALAAIIVLMRIALSSGARYDSGRISSWYGYAAFFLALPYPVLRTLWAFGAATGLTEPGAAGVGFIPWLASIPWILAAVLSLLLVAKKPLLSRRLLLAGGWTATAIVAMIGPAAFWSFLTTLIEGSDLVASGIKFWVFGLFYISWFLWFIAAGAATMRFQIRTAHH